MKQRVKYKKSTPYRKEKKNDTYELETALTNNKVLSPQIVNSAWGLTTKQALSWDARVIFTMAELMDRPTNIINMKEGSKVTQE